MADYILSCCSTADLTLEHLNKRNITYTSFHYYLDGVEYIDDLGQTLSHKDFYEALAKGAEPKTSQVNTEQYMEHFKQYLDQGLDVLHVAISFGISGSYNSAMLAKSILDEEYPDRKIIVINSLGGSGGYGLLMDKVADLRDSGFKIDDLAKWIEDNKLNMHHLFTLSDLSLLVRGGRLSKTSGLIGTALKLNPILTLDIDGKIASNAKAIGTKRAYKKLISIMIDDAYNGLAYDDKCYIVHSNIEEQAIKFAKTIEETFPNLKEPVLINSIGTTVGAHTGPGTIGLFYWGKTRTE